MSDAKRHLRAVPIVTAPVTTECEIAVRFTSTSGLIAPVRKPLNSFRWVGPGTLRFSEHGILVTAKSSTLLGLAELHELRAQQMQRTLERAPPESPAKPH